jgi:predicted nucleotidyltransferase/HEPN domain-containing protein
MTLSHLPPFKQAELQKLTSLILQNCSDIEKIILFGSYARGDYKEAKDLAENRKSGHISDYDILVVTSLKETALDLTLWGRIEDELRKLNLSAYPKLLTHDIEELNKKLEEGQYFYSDIKKEGIPLFNSGRFTLAAKKRLSLEERQKMAKGHYEHWFNRAEGFYDIFEYLSKKVDFDPNKKTNNNGLAAFNLHQAAESAYKTLLLVFTNYNPNEHLLEKLGGECKQYFPDLRDLFPKANPKDKARFDLLEYAYIGGRYDPDYSITKEDLEILAQDVKRLLELTERLCEEKIGFYFGLLGPSTSSG